MVYSNYAKMWKIYIFNSHFKLDSKYIQPEIVDRLCFILSIKNRWNLTWSSHIDSIKIVCPIVCVCAGALIISGCLTKATARTIRIALTTSRTTKNKHTRFILTRIVTVCDVCNFSFLIIN